jgi:hypothetical protein
MRKSIPKLALRKETVRTLATMDLVHVQGGSNADAAQAIEESTPKQCGATAAAVVVAPGG